MALIEWDSSLSVNVSIIDNEHKKLISVMNELNDAMSEGKSKDVLGKILSDLAGYTVSHFKTEERYFSKYGYPEEAGHKDEHDQFVQKVSDLKSKFDGGRVFLSIEIMNFLRDWLKNHIQGSDKKYTEFFNSQGLK